MQHPNYLSDRIPVTPGGLVVGDRILVVHTEGQADEQVEITVEAKGTEYPEPRHAKVTVWWGPVGDDRPHRVFDDPGQWLSVAYPRQIQPIPEPFPTASRVEVAA